MSPTFNHDPMLSALSLLKVKQPFKCYVYIISMYIIYVRPLWMLCVYYNDEQPAHPTGV